MGVQDDFFRCRFRSCVIGLISYAIQEGLTHTRKTIVAIKNLDISTKTRMPGVEGGRFTDPAFEQSL